jgi:hypothetical protein
MVLWTMCEDWCKCRVHNEGLKLNCVGTLIFTFIIFVLIVMENDAESSIARVESTADEGELQFRRNGGLGGSEIGSVARGQLQAAGTSVRGARYARFATELEGTAIGRGRAGRGRAVELRHRQW